MKFSLVTPSNARITVDLEERLNGLEIDAIEYKGRRAKVTPKREDVLIRYFLLVKPDIIDNLRVQRAKRKRFAA